MIPRISDSVQPQASADVVPKASPETALTQSFDDSLKKATKMATTNASATTGSSTETELKPTGEGLKTVDGHEYSSITDGVDKGMYLNLSPGSPREGEAFRIVDRSGNAYHVYGTGTAEVVERVGSSTSGASSGGSSSSSG
jgi:hypothetical protein